MALSFRVPAILVVVATAFIALVGSLLLNPLKSSSTLYCVSPSSPFHITTLNTSSSSSSARAKCFRVQDGVFTEVLSLPPLPEKPSSASQTVHLPGFVLPGIIESHGHILQYGEMLESVSLYGAESVKEIQERIKDFLAVHRGEGYGTRSKWIRGVGWDQAFWGGVMPTAEELADDPLLKDLYVMLDRVDVHCVLTSPAVLELLPTPLPAPPPGGVIVTDPGPGVFCDNAMDGIIYPLAPKPDVEQKTRWFRSAMIELNRVGITGVGDAGMRPEDISILESMAENGELSIRINVMLECAERNTYCYPEETSSLKLLSENGKGGLGGHMLMLGGIKLFADGALGSWGAALLEPYHDKPSTSGTMLINETALTSVVRKWYEAGFQVNVHAIGDRANRAAVNAFESVLGDSEECNKARRLRIEHAQIIHPDDQKRIRKMGIIPSIQPTHATSDMAYALARLGPERLRDSAYRMASFFPSPSRRSSSSSNSDGTYPGPVLGSDFPVEPPNPFHGMYAAVTRLNPATGTSPSGSPGWYPEESLTIEQALRGFTRNGAYGWFQEDRAGAIEVGKWADWVVVDRDVWADETGRSFREIVVRETWIGGRRVWSDEDGSPEGGGVDEGWIVRVKDVVRDPLTELVKEVRGLVEAFARLVEALTGLLRVLIEITERRFKVLIRQRVDEL